MRARRPWLMQFALLLLLAFVVGEGWWMFELGKTHGRTDLVKLRKEVRQQRRGLMDLGEQNADCRQTVANLGQGKEIDQLAYAEVERNLRDFNAEMADLKEEVAFYRNIVAPASNDRGLKIQSFTLEKIPQERSYRYKIVLIQVMPNQTVKGNVELKLAGMTQEGTEKNLSLRHVSKSNNIVFKFKYFQNLEGQLTFPQDFKPNTVTVEVNAQGGDSKNLSKTFEWQGLMG